MNAPTVTVTMGSVEDFRRSGSGRGSIAMKRPEARNNDGADKKQRLPSFLNPNNTSETILE